MKRRKTSCYSLALETETTETTWFSNARANCYNKHLENKSQTFHHLECILEQTNLFYLTLVILTSETSWVQKVEEPDKKKKDKRRRKLQQTKLIGCSVVERSGDIRKQALPYSNGLIAGAWIYVPVMTFPDLQRMLTQ